MGGMSDRYVVTSAAGEPVTQTNSYATACDQQAILHGNIIDTEATHD